MIRRIKTRLGSEQGFTLIELLVVIIILGILVAIAVPSYLSFRGNAQDAAAKANVRSAIPAAEAFYQDAAAGNGSYTGLTNATLASEAPGVSPNVAVTVLGSGKAYCLADSEDPNHGAYYVGGDTTGLTMNGATISSVTGSAGPAAVCGGIS